MGPGVRDRGDRPFAEALRQLRDERGMSQDDVAYQARSRAASITGSYVGKLERGLKRPSAETMAAIAAALEVDPVGFPEYRLAMARRQFDEREVGLDKALATLNELEDAVERRLLETDLEVPRGARDGARSGRRTAGERSGREGRGRKSA